MSSLLPAEAMCVLLISQCIISLLLDLRDKKKLYVMTAFYIGVIITTTANLLYIMKVAAGGVTEFSMYKYIVQAHIDEATAVWCLGNASIFVGYQLFKNGKLPPVSFDLSGPKTLKNLYTFIVVFAILNLTGNMVNLSFITGGIQKVLSLLNVMGILFYARLWVYEDNIQYRNYAITLAVLQTVIALYTSFLRVELLTPAISFFGGYFIGKGSIKYVFSARIIPALIFAGIFSLFFNTLAGNRSHFITAFTGDDNSQYNSSYKDLSEGEDKGEGGALERSANIAQLTNIVDLVKRNGYYGGAASFPLLAAFVPRLFWPDKPTIQLGTWFALEIGVASIGEGGRANNSVNMSVPGELYLDFGWIGVVLGCIFFGGLVAVFWNASEFNDSPYNLSGALWGGYLLLYAIMGIGADLQIVVSLVSTYIVFLIIKKVAKRDEGTSHRAAVEGE
jgi:hypothetical protein